MPAIDRSLTLSVIRIVVALHRYVDSCGSHRLDLIKQEDLVQQLRKVRILR